MAASIVDFPRLCCKNIADTWGASRRPHPGFTNSLSLPPGLASSFCFFREFNYREFMKPLDRVPTSRRNPIPGPSRSNIDRSMQDSEFRGSTGAASIRSPTWIVVRIAATAYIAGLRWDGTPSGPLSGCFPGRSDPTQSWRGVIHAGLSGFAALSNNRRG